METTKQERLKVVEADYAGPVQSRRVERNISLYLHLKRMERELIARMTECRDDGILDIDREIVGVQQMRAQVGRYIGLGYVGG